MSLVPAVTEMLFAVGAGSQVVAVSSYDHFPPEVDALPKVGALINPDTERILALAPDLVVVYGSQTEPENRFHKAGIRTFSYRHGGVDAINGTLGTIEEIGAIAGHAAEAQAVVARLRGALDAVRARVAGRPRPRTLLVIDRQPGTLQGLFAAGGIGFMQEMLDIAGADNVFADVKRESVQPSSETLLARAPEAVIEVQALKPSPAEHQQALLAWTTLESLPATRQHRVQLLSGDELVVAGPRLAQGTEALARALHPEAFK